MSLGEGTLEAKPKQRDGKKDGKQAFIWVIICASFVSTLLVAGLVLLLYFSHGKPNTPPGNTTVTDSKATTPGLTAEQQLRKELPAPICGTVRIKTGTKNVAEIHVPAGWSILAKPVSTKVVKLRHYVDGVEHPEPIVGANNDRKESWVIEDSQGINSLDLAVVLFVGKAPDEDTWYPLALTNGSLLRSSG